MIYIQTNEETNLVTMVHYMPFDPQHGMKDENGELLTEEQMKETGYLVDTLPKAEHIQGKRAITYYTEADGFRVEYVDVPKIDYPGVPQATIEKIQDDLTLAFIEAGIL